MSATRIHSIVSACALLAAAALTTLAADAWGQASEASALSALPIGVLSVAPITILASTQELTVGAVDVSAAGTTWVLERAADGVRASVRLSGNASVAVGTCVAVSAVTAGYVLSAAGKAVAFIPNEIGAALLYNERVSR